MNRHDLQACLRLLPPRWRKRLAWTLLLLAAYTLVGFLILPLIVRAVAVKRLSALLHREVTIQKVRLNPYVLSGSIRGLLVKDKDGEPLVSWDNAYANFQLVSFFGRPWVFKEVRVTKPFLRVQINRDRSLNFSDLLQQFSQSSSASAKAARPLSLRVSSLVITNATASFTDLTPSKPFHRLFGPAQINLTQFSTDPGHPNPFSIFATSDAGGKVSWNGSFSLGPIRSDGMISLEGLSLPSYAPLYQDLVRFRVLDGVVGLHSRYRLDFDPTNRIAVVSDATFSLRSLKIAGDDSTQELVAQDSLVVSGVYADAEARAADVASIYAEGGRLALRRDRDQKLNVLEMARPAESATNLSSGAALLMRAATNAFALFLRSTNQAILKLHRFEATNSTLVWDDLVNPRAVHLRLDQIAVSGRELSNLPGSNATATASLRWNTNGAIRMEATVQSWPPAADVGFALSDIDLGSLDPYLDPYANSRITRSKLSLDARVRLKTTTNALPEAAFEGNVRLDDFAAVDSLTREDLVGWKSLRLSGLRARLIPPEATIGEVALLDAFANVTIETNHLINVLAALKRPDTNAPVQRAKLTPAPQPRGGNLGVGKRFGAFIQEALASSTNATAFALAPRIAVNTVVVSNAVLRFHDRSLAQPVRLSVQNLNGTLTGFSSDELKRADLQFDAKVDGASPVEIRGKINPLNQKAPTELRIALHDLDLMPDAPYVGKYAGYRLSRGKLSLDLDYGISNRQLTASNLIVLDQFTLGERVDSPDATKLPLRLAVAVLKDRSGKIELDVPIEGSLDDPQFRLGKVITRAIVNVLTKIVTSPFAALSAVFGGKGEELSFQDFAPGSDELLPADAGKLQALAKGLYERPGLSVEIEGSVDPAADRQALALRKLEQRFRLAQWTAMSRAEQAKVKPDEIELKPEAFQDYVKEAYARAFSPEALAARTNGVVPPEASSVASAARPGNLTAIRKGAQELTQQRTTVPKLSLEEMQQQLLQSVEITDDDFRQLATRRVERVKEFLLHTGQVEAERVLLPQDSKGAVLMKGSRAYLHLR